MVVRALRTTLRALVVLLLLLPAIRGRAEEAAAVDAISSRVSRVWKYFRIAFTKTRKKHQKTWKKATLFFYPHSLERLQNKKHTGLRSLLGSARLRCGLAECFLRNEDHGDPGACASGAGMRAMRAGRCGRVRSQGTFESYLSFIAHVDPISTQSLI